MKNQYFFKNIGFYSEHDLSKLETFEYYTNEDIPKKNIAESVFLQKEELFDVELKYQKNINLHDKYNLESKDKNKVIIYDEYSLKNNIIFLMDKNGLKYQKSFLDNDISIKVFDLIDDILSWDIDMDIENDVLEIFQKRIKNLQVS